MYEYSAQPWECRVIEKLTTTTLLSRRWGCFLDRSSISGRIFDAETLDVLVDLREDILHGLDGAVGHPNLVPLDAAAARALTVVVEDADRELILDEVSCQMST